MSGQYNGKAGDVHVAYMRGHHSSPVSKGNLEGAIGGAFIVDGRALMMNICAAPESAIATCGVAGIAALANLMVSGGEITFGGDTLETTIVSTSSSGSKTASIHIWVEYDESVT